jgi:carbon starvation protein
MSLLAIALGSAVCLLAAYAVYGRVLSRLLRLDPEARTPAVELRDDVDYSPIAPGFLLSQHFSAIAAAGPIVGPILAGAAFGWGPALLWILLGSIFIGGVHDMTALVASIRHRARSIAEVVREHMSPRSYLLFLGFIWITLVYIIVAFTDITAASFTGVQVLENGESVTGGGIATSSLLYLALPMIMGVCLRYTKLSLGWATVIFLPLVAAIIWLGQRIPLDLGSILGVTDLTAHKIWNVSLVLYCLVAAMVPVWLLLQPRGHLGGYFLFAALLVGLAGFFVPGRKIDYPVFIGFTSQSGSTLFPILFITIACGACSGFHALIASGTTSKQLRRETDARSVGYGSMLLEAMVAIIALSCVMVLPRDSDLAKQPPNLIYASGIGAHWGPFWVSFGLMAFTTFVYDTLDVCTRLGRYIIQEFTGWRGAAGKWFSTAATAGVPLYFLLGTELGPDGKRIQVWRTFWELFGASNQLLAALTLLGVTVWLWRSRGAWWVWLVTGVPMAWMYTMSFWALVGIVTRVKPPGAPSFDLVGGLSVVLLALALLMLVEAAVVILGPRTRPPRRDEPRPVPATA